MADFKIYGRVAELFDPRTGTKKDGSEWSMQDILIEEASDKYLSMVAATIDNYRTSEQEGQWVADSVERGTMLTFSCSISSRKWEKDGRSGYATSVRVWRIEEGDTRHAEPRQPQRNATANVVRVGVAEPAQPQPAPVQSAPVSDDLPF